MSADAIISIGSDAQCGLVIEDPSVASLHAQIRMDPQRFVWLRDENSRHGTHLYRNGHWIQIRLITVSQGDLLRFGETEVSSDRLLALFGSDLRARLAPVPRGSVQDRRTGRYRLEDSSEVPTLAGVKRKTLSEPGEGQDS